MLDRRTLLAGASGLILSGPSFAQAPSEADWKKVLEAAKKEGEVAFYSSGIARQEEPRMKAFEEKTGIRVRYSRPGGGEIIIRKLQTEIQAGKPLADLCSLTDKALGTYAEMEGWTAPVAIPNLAKLDPAFPIDSPHVPPSGGFTLPIVINTKMMKKEDAPKSYADLADPRFKSKILLGAPENAGSTTLLIKAWLELYGWDFVEKLRKNDVAEMRLQAEATQAVARGEKPICVVAQSWAYTNIKQGAPLEVIFPSDGVVLAETTLIRTKGGPNPNAGLVLADYLFSPEYQADGVGATGSYGSALGVPKPDIFPALADLKRHKVDLAALLKQRGEIIDRWRRIMS